MEISSLKSNPQTVESGEWISDIPQMGEVRLKVRSLNYSVFKTLISRKSRAVPTKDRERDNSIKEDVLHRIRGEALHEAILLDWDGLTDAGKPVPFNSDQALQLLTEKDFADFQYAVLYAAGVAGKDRADLAAEAAKNSKPSLSGS